jgi:hypothetical protein
LCGQPAREPLLRRRCGHPHLIGCHGSHLLSAPAPCGHVCEPRHRRSARRCARSTSDPGAAWGRNSRDVRRARDPPPSLSGTFRSGSVWPPPRGDPVPAMCAAPEDVAAGGVPEHPEALVAELRRSRVTAAGIPARVVPGAGWDRSRWRHPPTTPSGTGCGTCSAVTRSRGCSTTRLRRLTPGLDAAAGRKGGCGTSTPEASVGRRPRAHGCSPSSVISDARHDQRR